MTDLEVQLEIDDQHSKGTSAGWYHLWSHAFSSASSDTKTSSRNTRAVAWEGIFPLRRGGVVVFALRTKQPFSIAVTPSSTAEAPEVREGLSPALELRVDCSHAELVLLGEGKQIGRALARTRSDDAGYSKGQRESFWLSLDADSKILKYGKGSRTSGNILLQYNFGTEGDFLPSTFDSQFLALCFESDQKLIQLAGYDGPPVVQSTMYDEPLLQSRAAVVSSVTFEELPLVSDPSPRLLEDHQMLLSDFAQEDFAFPANLSPTIQDLSRKILQPCLSLENIVDGNGNVLRDAMRHSLQTPGLTLYNHLQGKISRLAHGERSAAQISIALAPSQGNSPGAPITLEILPPGHCSLPHDNARACGVLRLLQGNMDVLLFDEDLAKADEGNPLDEVEMERGDAFWFSANWYQTHAMRNVGSDFCCYLMARQYEAEDDVRWPHLRYKDGEGQISSQPVVADLGFKEMQAAVTRELAAALQLMSPSDQETETNLMRTASMRTQSWVDRTDSAMDYTAYYGDGKFSPAGEPDGQQYSHSRFRRTGEKQHRGVRYLLTSPAIPEGSRDLSTLWP